MKGRENMDFNRVKAEHLKTLEQYVPIVARVHGGSHPEFLEVQEIFETMHKKLKAAGNEKPELISEFQQLREVTDNYTVPDDVCESYAAVYKMLAALDEAY
jgi:iron-sulfur cluster repair protein YtfE (RIC family)